MQVLRQLYGYFLMLGWSAYAMICAGESILTSLEIAFGIGSLLLIGLFIFEKLREWQLKCKTK